MRFPRNYDTVVSATQVLDWEGIVGRSSDVRAGARPGVLGVLNGAGNLFVLSLSCTLACCLVVTAYPALASQQRALQAWVADSDSAVASLFWRQFRASVRSLLLPGVVYLVALAVCVGSALVWAAAPLPWR